MLGRSKSVKKKASSSELPSTPQEELPTARPEEEKEPLHAPTGLVNDGNTCYLNSVFQSLIHTPPLSTLLTPIDCLDRPWMPAATCEVNRQRHPAFMTERNHNKDLMPLAASFIESAGRSWRTELAGLEVTKGDRKGQGLKTLLYTISKKYDQYGDYDQQDAHELLRHLLDSMRMEEVDVIKRLHPKPAPQAPVATPDLLPTSPSSNTSPQPSLSTSSTETSPLPPIATPEPTEEGSLEKRDSRVSFTEGPHKDMETSTPLVSNVVVEPEAEPHDMMSFVDLLFGGRLASMIVCETCKSVSHTYEDFMDLSMGLPQEEPRERKRDRLMSIARKLGGKSSKPDDDSAVASDEEDEGSDHKLFGSRRLTSGAESNPPSAPVSRRGSTVSGNEGGANLGRRGSIFSGLASLSISRKKSISSRRSSAAQSDRDTPGGGNSRPSSPSVHPSDHGDEIPPLSSAPTLNSMKSPPPQFSNLLDPKFPKVKLSQAAYIRRILGSAPNPNPLAALKLPPHAEATVGGWLGLPSSSQNGLMDSLRQFTKVEVLEGENSFACKKCWRWENPRSDGRPWRRGGETGNDADDEDEEEEPDLAQVDKIIEPISEAERLEPQSIVSAPTSAGTSPFLSAADLSASTVSAPDVLTSTPSSSPYPPLSFEQKSGFDAIKVDTTFPDDPSPDTPSGLGVDYGGGQIIPTINTIPFSPESETPPEISTTAPSPAPSISNGLDKAFLAAPTKRATNLRPSASRGHSYTRHVNPAFKDGSDSENSDASSAGSFASSDEDESSLGSGVEQSPSSETAALPAGADGSKPVPSRPKPTRKKSSRFVMRRAFKRYLIVNPPPILVFHLKRFEQITGRGFGFGGFAGNFKKIDTFISFPLVIDVAPFLAPARIGAPLTLANSSAKKRAGKEVVDAVPYHLSAIVVHLGTMGQGHYVSYVLSSPDDPPPHHTPASSPNPPTSPSTTPLPLSNTTSQISLPLHHSSSHHHPHFRHGKKHPEKEVDPRVWWYCSDTLVQQVPVEEVLKAKAYLLFFQKTQTTI